MSYDTYLAYLNSDHWRSTKLKAFAKVGFRCQCCGTKKRIEGHHLIYRTPLSAGLVDDVLPMCESCHKILHNTPSLDSGYKRLASVAERRAFIIAAFKPKRVEKRQKTVTVPPRRVWPDRPPQRTRKAPPVAAPMTPEQLAARRERRRGRKQRKKQREIEREARNAALRDLRGKIIVTYADLSDHVEGKPIPPPLTLPVTATHRFSLISMSGKICYVTA